MNDTLPTDPAPKTKKTPAKRQRRNYAAELVELQASVKVALLIIKTHSSAKTDPVFAIVVALLEGKD